MTEDRTGNHVLVRITDNPQLARGVPLLPPEILHAVITQHGLHDCGELLALATPQQLSAVFDLDLWKAPRAGGDEQFDPARFCEWLEVLVDLGPAVAASRVAQMEPALVVAGLAPQVRVFDIGVFEPTEERDSAEPVLNPGGERGVHAEIGGYVVVARRPDAWDAIVDVLLALDAHEPETFDRVMRGCRTLSNAGRELDGLDDLLADGEQAQFELSVGRDQRRERQGFLAAEQARAFLASARHLSLAADAPPRDLVFAEYERSHASPDAAGPLAAGSEAPLGSPTSEASAATAIVIDVLREGGVLAGLQRPLLPGAVGESPVANAALDEYLRRVAERGPEDVSARNHALVFLANALVAGCSVQSRPFTRPEAMDAVAATCNLGLECWPGQWPASSSCDLIAVFQVGWAVLHREVSMRAGTLLIEALDDLQTSDPELQFGLRVLRRELHRELQAGTPWRVCERLEALSPFDLPTWAALTSLFDECPVMLANVSATRDRPALRVDPSKFQFVSERRHVAAIRDFLGSLAERLTG